MKKYFMWLFSPFYPWELRVNVYLSAEYTIVKIPGRLNNSREASDMENTNSPAAAADIGNWTEAVEDLVHDGQVEKAISLLETVVSKLETDSKLGQLSAALLDLSKLYANQGLSIKADETRSRAFLLEQISLPFSHQMKDADDANKSSKESRGKGISEYSNLESSSDLQGDGSKQGGSSVDDWEAIADRDPNELLSPSSLPEVSNLSLQDSKVQAPKRRGRGTFLYQKYGLYSDEQSEGRKFDYSDDDVSDSTEGSSHSVNLKYGTSHVLVLADFPKSTRTTDLEKLLEKHKDQVAIRWVNDEVALAVFRTPSEALEASSSIEWPFSKHILNEDDELLKSIPPRDLEPPRQRPRTSARTAQRMIAQSIGIKLPSDFGSRELRRQEEARKNRIVARQNKKGDAWGDDDTN
nr:R3H and coiled-coil domain-containing protein 1 isoform X1 [Ipomoea batatas]